MARLRSFVQNFTLLIDEVGNDENRVFADGKQLLSELVSQDDWLPDRFARPNPDRYQQYLLHCDPMRAKSTNFSNRKRTLASGADQ